MALALQRQEYGEEFLIIAVGLIVGGVICRVRLNSSYGNSQSRNGVLQIRIGSDCNSGNCRGGDSDNPPRRVPAREW